MSKTIEAELSQHVLKQRLPEFFSQTLAKLEEVPEFAASPRIPNPKPTGLLPYEWMRSATLSRGPYQYTFAQTFWAEDLQLLQIGRDKGEIEQEDSSINLDLQGRKARGIIAASVCYIIYDRFTTDDWETYYNSEPAFGKITALVAELLQAPA